MNNIRYKGEVFTFWQLLKNISIEIPIIQRDYAQGRVGKEELRDNFLGALNDSLCNNKPIKLDFIYGSQVMGAFQPLDGQQRLTTLFLLYWYAALKDNALNEENIEILKKFSYETRASSREFCIGLVTNPILISDESEKISPLIIDSSWFFLSWKKDPTIDAMLRAIDDIHRWFCGVDDLWSKLIEQELISFYHVELENIGLTDDLYIKMNARGKLLSPYENFKASFQKYITENKWEKCQDFKETFACKIDTVWMDLFWKHRKGDSIDEAFMRFISTIAMIHQAIDKKEDRLSNISKIQRDPNSVKIDNFSNLSFAYLCECLNIYSKVFEDDIDISLNLNFWQHTPEKSIFSALVYEDNVNSFLRNSASYTQKVLFFAQTEYLKNVQEFNRENFLCWMRVIRNIVCRGDVERNGNRPAIIRSPETFEGVVNLIRELSEGCNDIYHYLATKENIKSAFAKEQIEEEKIKSKLIVADERYKKVLFAVEDTNLLQGRIEFAFNCIDYDGNVENFKEQELYQVQEVIIKYFDSEITNGIRRALLTICDDDHNYKYYEYWWSFSFVVEANKRCLIDKFRELEYYIYGNYKNKESFRIYLKKLVIKLIDSDPEEIVANFVPPTDMPNWKVRLITETKLLDEKCMSHYIAIPPDESCCYLLKSVRPRDIDGCEEIK